MCEINDIYKTIASPSEAVYIEKRSKFLAFAFPVYNADDIRAIIKEYQQKYYDARHICYAYMLGQKHDFFRTYDNGEPSGTAGKPILGQINSAKLTNILIIVVRYFGGIKLGTSGLIVAYRTAAANVISLAQIIEKTVNEEIVIHFEYPYLSSVMRIVKDLDVLVIEKNFDMNCTMRLRLRKSLSKIIREHIKTIETLYIDDKKNTSC